MDSEVIPVLHCRCLRSILFTLFIRSWVSDLFTLYSIIHSIIPFLRRWLRFEIGVRSQGSFLFGSSPWARTGAAFSTRLLPSAYRSRCQPRSLTCCRRLRVVLLECSFLSSFLLGAFTLVGNCVVISSMVFTKLLRLLWEDLVWGICMKGLGERCVSQSSVRDLHGRFPSSEAPPRVSRVRSQTQN